MPAKSLFRALIALILLSAFALASVGRISAVNGEVSIQRGAKTEKALSSFQLEEKDVIKSTTGSTAQLIFNDKTVITVGSNTTFKIEEYLFGEKDNKARFSVGEGTFKTITGKIAKVAPDKFKVETKTATIGIRGTIFVGNVNQRGILTIACTKGIITVTPTIPQALPVIVNQGQMTTATPKGVEPPKVYTPIQLQNIEKPLAPVQQQGQSGTQGGSPSSGFMLTTVMNGSQPSTTTVVQNFVNPINSIVGEIKTTEKTTVITKTAETCQPGYTGTYPNCVAPACPSGYTGTYPNCVAPTCPTGYTGTYPNCVAPACPTGYTGTYPNCTAPTCPSGYTGTYPNCVAPTCPTGYTGTYPNCTAPTCQAGYTGTYPNCVAPTCPSGYTGTYPNCTAPTCQAGYTGTYPNCVAPACPAGYSGLYPNCIAVSCPSGYTGTYPDCTAPTCPSGYTGTYPSCVAPACPSGYTGTYPNCVAPTCPSGYTGTYPDCVAPTCPSGYTGTYPNCVAPTCPAGYTGVYPACVAPACPSGYSGTYPSCVAPSCPAGYSGSYPDCVAPPPPVSVCPSGYSGVYPDCVLISSFTSLFSSLNTASLGSTTSIVLPDSTSVSIGMRQYTFDKAQSEPIYKRAWVSSDFQYIATDMSGDLYSMIYAADNSAIYDETSVNTFYANCISGCSAVGVGSIKSIFVKTDVANPVSSSNIVEARNFASSAYAGTAGDFSFFAPIAKTYTDLVTSVKNLSSLYGAFQDTAIKYETISIYPVRNWNSLTNAGGHAEPDLNNAVFEEKYYHDNDGEWYITGRFAANYSDLTALTPSQLTVLNTISSQAFYIFDVPTTNQNLPAYGQLPEGGKWYFSYDSANPNFTGTIQALAGSSLTDAVLTTASSVPFMVVENPLTYPIYVVDMSGYKNMYSLKAYGDYASDFNQNSNLYNFLINTHHVEATGSAVDSYVRVADPQAVYVFNKIDNDGTLAADLRNGRLVNPMTGVPLDVYANFMLYDSPDYYYFSGPIENPIFSDTTTYNVGVMGSGTLAIANNPLAGAPYWKLAIERAPFADMPVDDSLFVYGSYASIPNSADFINPAKTGTYIGYPASGEGILMESYLNVATDALLHNYYTGSVTTGRVVDDNGLNKIAAKHFDMLGGITTTGVANAGGYTSNQYLFNENGQYINADIGGLDNDKGNTSDKYNWIVGEVLYDGVAVNVGLMKKVTDQSDSNLFQHIWGYTPPSLPMSGFMIGSDTLLNTWMGDIIAMDTATSSSGELAIGAVSDDLGIATHKSMSGLSQGASSVSVASASFLGEDLQAMIVESKTVNGKTYDFAMATLPDYVVVDGDVKYSYIDDYSSWGYWMAREQGAVADSFAQGYWVGGYETPSATIAAISVNTQYDYYGQALGNLTDGVQIAPIKLDGDNIFNLSVKFGTSKPVQITQIKFNTVGLGSVDTGVLSANFGSGLPSAITGSNFSAVAIGGDVTNMNIKGKFYGPGAESVGGAWAGSFNNGSVLNGTGVFKAIRPVGP